MTGILFHGPQVFDSGWAKRIMQAFPDSRCMLAGTMSRTALFDSGLEGVEAPGKEPSACVRALAEDCQFVLLATASKSLHSGLSFGQMVAARVDADVSLVQAECCDPAYAVLKGECALSVSDTLQGLGFLRTALHPACIDIWREGEVVYRRMSTAEEGDYVLVNGIFIGRADGSEVVLAEQGRHIAEVRGVHVKAHGLEKLERLGGVDLATAKLASTACLRSGAVTARIGRSDGEGVAFIDHAGMHVYTLAQDTGGAVTVGDDTTAVTGDILRRFGVPVIGVVDGDGDSLHADGGLAPGSVVLTVKADDEAGLEVQKEIFKGQTRSSATFDAVKEKVISLLGSSLIARVDY